MSPRRSRPPVERLSVPGLPPGVSAVEVRRSARRQTTITARQEGDVFVVLVPARLTPDQERVWIDKMLARLAAKRTRRPRSDADLMRRAAGIATRYLDGPAGVTLRPRAVRWVTNMNRRWASCSTDTAEIRLSHRLEQMPDWVLDYVLAHELVHLTEPGHGRRFQALLAEYPLAERAEGFLRGWSAAQGLPQASGLDDDEEPVD